MEFVNGVNLLPSTGEFTYDTICYRGHRANASAFELINAYGGEGPDRGDIELALDQLQAAFPSCITVAIVVSWFGNSTDVENCKIFPSTTYIGGGFEKWSGNDWVGDVWRCSELTQLSQEIIPLPMNGESFIYGGTPSDQSIVRCIRALRSRGLRIVFYPFILMTCQGLPWRGRIAYSGPDISESAASAVAKFLGMASPSEFSRDTMNLTVGYSGPPSNYTYRRMILHYANLCVIAGGVDLFLLGSELRGLETIRGPGWSAAGTVDENSHAAWDYPFVGGLSQLSDDVRGIFDEAGLTKNVAGLHNLISYAADWSTWMGCDHSLSNPASSVGLWPHLDSLWSSPNIDLVCFDNYLPMSDWTTGSGGLDARLWCDSAPIIWPPADPLSIGLGLTGAPTLYSKEYLKANIEGGERFNWFYVNSRNKGVGLDPFGTDLRVSCVDGDRLTQARNRYYPNQEILAQKQVRWWWSNSHRALYDSGDGAGESPKGQTTAWFAHMKSVAFTEYGFASTDRSTNQPNAFFDAKSSESATAYWSIWDSADGAGYLPRTDLVLQSLALQAFHEYWFTDVPSNNPVVDSIHMIQPEFCSVWNWDARPFPIFPVRSDVWADGSNWSGGSWLTGKSPPTEMPIPDPPPELGSYFQFPTFVGRGWCVRYQPQFSSAITRHASGRQCLLSRMSTPIFNIEIGFDLLRMDPPYAELQEVIGFVAMHFGRHRPFLFPAPIEHDGITMLTCRLDDEGESYEEFMERLVALGAIKFRSVKGE